MRELEIRVITADSFKRYGVILEPEDMDVKDRRFEVIVEASSNGWRIGVLDMARNDIPYLERHLKTKETLEPVFGTMLLFMAPPDNPEDLEVFLLDKPVCIKEKVWHQIMSISEKARIKVAENIEVPPYESENYKFKNEIRPVVLL